ncbi:MAG: hypothetical protein HYZ72_14195 [Deltaproteobacteria bacterium]|nr:hypothetical protein [Deltaproteobacteria bacterium]
MTKLSVEEIYQQHIKPLPVAARLRLIEMTAHDLMVQPPEGELPQRHNWMSVRGIASNLLGGEDAQGWVSRTRREADEHREKQWKRQS